MRTIEREGQFHTYAYLYITAWNSFDAAQVSELGRNHHLLSANIFSAFTLEAYLNHLGKLKCDAWDILEPTLRTEQKLQLIAMTIGAAVDRGKRPFQSWTEIFRLRNFFAHGKTQEIQDVIQDPLPRDAYFPSLDPKEITRISIDATKKILEDMQCIIEFLHRSAGLPEHSVWSVGSSVSTIIESEPKGK